MTMSQTTAHLKKDIDDSLDRMRTLRDELRVKLHLAGMEAKDEWRRLEPQIAEIERAAEQITEASRAKIADAVKRLTHFRKSLS
jgi:hypothetical protein